MVDADWFAQKVLEQNSRPAERRCPLARASNEVVEILSEYWAIFAPGCEFPCLPYLCSEGLTGSLQIRRRRRSNRSS